MAVRDVINQIESDINKISEMDSDLEVLLNFAREAGEDTTKVEAETRANRLRLNKFKNALANTKAKLGE
jgi:hypothetical protein